MRRIVFTKQAQKDAQKLAAAGLRSKAETLLDILRDNPYQTPPPFEKLIGDLEGACSRRISIQHRLIYQVLDDEKAVKVIQCGPIVNKMRREKTMSSIEYLRIFSDADGRSHFDSSTIDLKMNDYAPPATPLNTSPPESARAMFFLELPVGWFGDWHPTPVRQWLFFLTGECEFETGDGERCRRKAGSAVMLDDTMGKGHRTRVIGDITVRIAAVHCP